MELQPECMAAVRAAMLIMGLSVVADQADHALCQCVFLTTKGSRPATGFSHSEAHLTYLAWAAYYWNIVPLLKLLKLISLSK